ncbi:MAG TPA: peptidoglycan-associated lipoprotein Pal [Acidobacteriota bacterium]|nr:peptidoglycan-associated lipoprotein Pal [Acidobacteriota bacterium]
MKRSLYLRNTMALVVLALLILGTGCAKKTPAPQPEVKAEPEKPPAPPAPAPAPTITLRVSPPAIEMGQSSVLSWTSSNAVSVTIDNGVGTVETSGSRDVRPSTSTTYQVKATGPGGTAVAEARVTVTAPPAVTPPPPPSITDSEFFSTNIKDAFFDYDQYSIREDARASLQADARALKQRPSIRITIEGHADERGSEKYNLALGDRRATAAKDFLVGQGIDASRLETISYGKEQNFCEEHNEACWQSNRRAHLVMR